MEFRPARKDDLERIVSLLADDELAAKRRYPTEVTPSIVTAWKAIEADANNTVYVAHRERALVGTLQVTIIPSLSFGGAQRAQIEAVRVAASERDTGVGRQMLELAIHEARSRGVGQVQLSCARTRVDAHRFYRSLGFRASHTGFKLRL